MKLSEKLHTFDSLMHTIRFKAELEKNIHFRSVKTDINMGMNEDMNVSEVVPSLHEIEQEVNEEEGVEVSRGKEELQAEQRFIDELSKDNHEDNLSNKDKVEDHAKKGEDKEEFEEEYEEIEENKYK